MAPQASTLRALRAVRRLREIEREQARLGWAAAGAVHARALQAERQAEQRLQAGVQAATQAFEMRGDVQARSAWLDHLGLLHRHQASARQAGRATQEALARARSQLVAADARLQATEALGDGLATLQACVAARRAAHESDALWLARSATEGAAW